MPDISECLLDELSVTGASGRNVIGQMAEECVCMSDTQSIAGANRFSVAAPPPVLRVRAEAGHNGIEYDVDARLDEVLLPVDRLRVVRASEEMSAAVMALVEPKCVSANKPLHSSTKVRPRGADHQMQMGIHQAVRLALPLEAMSNEA